MLEADMWSGWGVRSLSASHAAYNRSPTKLGSIWPHDNAILARGFCAYGHGAEASKIARALFDAANDSSTGDFPRSSWSHRDEGSFPVQYLGANVPQAWASGAIVHSSKEYSASNQTPRTNAYGCARHSLTGSTRSS